VIWGLVAGLAAAALFGVGAVVQAHAVRRQDARPDRLDQFLASSARDPWTIAVVVSYLAGFGLHVVAIWELPLYLAQATIAMSLPVTAVTSIVLNERLQPVHWWSVGLVSVGLLLLSIGSGDPGGLFTSAWFAALMWVGVVALCVAARFGIGWSGATLGGLAGLGYAGSAIAVRGAEASLDVWSVVAALSVPTYGVVAFWLYSVGLDRAPVSSASAPLIVGETFVPALVGVLLLGDGVRPGWWPGVIVGLVLAMVGAIVLSGDGIASPVRDDSESSADQAS
jgi:drug/metabolite transporter (DMT)-like permease